MTSHLYSHMTTIDLFMWQLLTFHETEKLCVCVWQYAVVVRFVQRHEMNQRCWRTVQVGHEHRRTEQLQYRISLSSGGQTDVSICPPVLHTATSIQNKPRLLHSSSVFCRAGERPIHKASQNTHGEEKKDTYCAADGGRWRAAGPRLIPVRWPSSVTECVCVFKSNRRVLYNE